MGQKVHKKLIFVLTILLAVNLNSCNKEIAAPSIAIDAPIVHTEFNYDDSIHIKAKFEDPTILKKYTVYLGNSSGDTISPTINVSGLLTGTSFVFDQKFAASSIWDFPDDAYINFAVTNQKNYTRLSKVLIHF